MQVHLHLDCPLPPLPSPPKKQNAKTSGFIVFLLTNVSKTSVLSVLERKKQYKTVLRTILYLKSCMFSENPCAKIQKT